MQRGIGVFIVLLAFGLLCFYCLGHHRYLIQQDVSNRVMLALAARNIPTQGLEVNGRDVLLIGPAGSPLLAEGTQKLVAGVYGVRTMKAAETAPDARTLGARAAAQTKLNALLARRVVEFDPASASLTARGRGVLDEIAPLLAASPALFCEIQGHTDSQGDPGANQALSYRRALAAKNYLVEKGIAAARLEPKAFGGAQPIASNETAAGRQRNRRIEFLLKEKP